jgi:hypothetical protein
MNSQLILHRLRSTGSALVAFNQVAALREAANLAAAQVPVRWEFEPSTPATVVDYLTGAGQGAVEGGLTGLGVGVLLAAIFPPAVIGYAVAGGAFIGAVNGAQRVHQGWRIRLVRDWRTGQDLLEVRMAA